jgi:hypothetical protein
MSAASASRSDWADANQRDLVAQVGRLRATLERGSAPLAGGESSAPSGPAPGEDFAVAALTRLFALSSFERDVILLCASIELDGSFGDLVAAAHGDPARRLPTFGLALARLADPHWSALTPAGPLRRWRLVELGGGGLSDAPLRLDERILHFLAGVNQLDERLSGLVEQVSTPGSPSRAALDAGRLLATQLARADGPGTVQVAGPEEDLRTEALGVAAEALGATMLLIRARNLPASGMERSELALVCRRESLMSRSITVLDASTGPDDDRVMAFADAIGGPVVVCGVEPMAFASRPAPIVEVAPLAPAERLELWRTALGHGAGELNGALARVAELQLGPRGIDGVVAELRAGRPALDDVAEDALVDASQRAARPAIGGLAQRIDPRAGWSDLVLPESQLQLLRLVAAHVRHRHRVYEEWGFAARSARGLGIGALFAGESGTGKTMAAEVLARELRLDLYRIDLATVVSKYIGETEKNLKQLFDGAEGSGAILLFDEADALFGKRTEVRDSHDRYANVEISYLLQRMEGYRGLAILTTNMKQALDPAFVRRLRFIVRFPYPDASQRAAIWRRVIPDLVPVGPLDHARLGQLNVAGGHIRNIAIGAAFLAAERSEPVTMRLIGEAARLEYAKLERPVSDAETRGWA